MLSIIRRSTHITCILLSFLLVHSYIKLQLLVKMCIYLAKFVYIIIIIYYREPIKV